MLARSAVAWLFAAGFFTAHVGVAADAPNAEKSAAAVKALNAELQANLAPSAELAAKGFATVALTKADAAAAREALWKAHAAAIAKDRAEEMKSKVLKDGKLSMKFSYKLFGKKPEGGRSLFISLHGGGGGPARMNDSQWENQKGLYTPEEGVYLAPRAPTDNWNLWHEPHIDRLFGRLIEDLIVLEEIDPDRVYLLGYSAGGDGAYQLAPRMADHWGAAAMMAGHPNDASPLGLRNLPFAIYVGGRDAAYNRNKVAAEWGEKLDKLQADDQDGYPHLLKIFENKGHWMDREDAAALPWMAKHRRNPTPNRVVWKQAGTTHDRFYWLAVPPREAKGGSLVTATLEGQTVDIVAAEGVGMLLIRLSDKMLDLDEPIRVTQAGKTLFEGLVPRNIATQVKTLVGRGDPKLVFDAEIAVEVTSSK